MPYIVELRSNIGQPSLFALDHETVCEITQARAKRFTYEKAKEIARREKALRPGLRVLTIEVES